MVSILPQSIPRNDTQWGTFFKKLDDVGTQHRSVLNFGAVGDDSTNDSAALQDFIDTAKTTSETIWIPRGFFVITKDPPVELIFDHITYEPASQMQRPNIRGDGLGVTVLKTATSWDFSLVITGAGTDEQAHTYMTISDLSFAGGAESYGLHMKNAAFAKLQSIGAFGLYIGIQLEGVLSSSLDNIYIRSCVIGLDLLKSTFSGVNLLKISNSNFGLCSAIAVNGAAIQTNILFESCAIESCGGGNVGDGGIVLTFDGSQGCAGATFIGCYFEANYGDFDVELVCNNVPSGTPVTNCFINCNFNRISSTVYVTNNVRINGPSVTTFIGCAFTGFGTYSPNAGRPYVNATGGAVIRFLNCSYGSTLERPSPDYDYTYP